MYFEAGFKEGQGKQRGAFYCGKVGVIFSALIQAKNENNNNIMIVIKFIIFNITVAHS